MFSPRMIRVPCISEVDRGSTGLKIFAPRSTGLIRRVEDQRRIDEIHRDTREYAFYGPNRGIEGSTKKVMRADETGREGSRSFALP